MIGLTHIDTWQCLVVEARWKPKQTVDRIVATPGESLLVGAVASAVRRAGPSAHASRQARRSPRCTTRLEEIARARA